MKIIAVIPARGGSKGVPRKNIKMIAGKPLIVWSIEQAKGSRYISKVYVSTDDRQIAKVSKRTGAIVIDRPKELAGDTAESEDVLIHLSKEINYDYDIMVFLQCTSPLRTSKQIDEAIEKFIDKKVDSLFSGCKNDRFYWINNKSINYDYRHRPRRQDKEWEIVENGSIYIFKKDILLMNKNRLGGKITHYIMPKWMSFEVDEPFDFELIEYLMESQYVR